MSQLLKNALTSIRLGVEDFQSDDSDRALSALRNYYSGLLLLAKEVLVRRAPEADMEMVIARRYKPVLTNDGNIRIEPDGNQTVDFSDIKQRFKQFDIKIERKSLDDLNLLRCNVEHFYTKLSDEQIRETIARAFPFTSNLFRLANIDPVAEFGATWQIMIDNRELYDSELKRCQSTVENVKWQSQTISKGSIICPKCSSELVEQSDPENTDQDSVEFHCCACGENPSLDIMITKTLERELDAERYISFSDGGDEGDVIHDCPECWNNTFVVAEGTCAVCSYEFTPQLCGRCPNPLTLDDVTYGDGVFCAYCADKIARAKD